MGGGENKYQELSRCPWTSGVGSASGAEMASREEALIVQILCSEMDYRSLIDPLTQEGIHGAISHFSRWQRTPHIGRGGPQSH